MDDKKKVFAQFLTKKQLAFNEIEKATHIRSNKLAYSLKQLQHEGIIEKQEKYQLTPNAEKHIPFFINNEEELSPLPVVLVACMHNNRVLLVRREKRPYKDLWALPGGRIHLHETLQDAALRILKKKTYVDGTFCNIHAVINEKVRDNNIIKHGYIIFFVTVTPTKLVIEKEHLTWASLDKLDTLAIVPSDKWLLQHKLNEHVEVTEEILEEHQETYTLKL